MEVVRNLWSHCSNLPRAFPLYVEEKEWVHTYLQSYAEGDALSWVISKFSYFSSFSWAHLRVNQIACPPRTTTATECFYPTTARICINSVLCRVNWMIGPIWLMCHKDRFERGKIMGDNCDPVQWDWTCRNYPVAIAEHW